MKEALILILMIFAHIVDDYYLQGWLASGKQKSWWEKNAPNPKFKHDYIMALCMHAFSWAFVIMLPPLWFLGFFPNTVYLIILSCNFVIHAIIDNLKANKGKINLIQDQSIHLGQIIISWALICFI